MEGDTMTNTARTPLDGGEYPRRPPYFAQRFIRLMTKTCLANEMGQDAFCLLTTIASMEDVKRYRRPVSFRNDQLLPILGFAKWERLNAARSKAVSAGWLRYIEPRKGTREPGLYWVLVPSDLDDLPDTPIDETTDPIKAAYFRGYQDGREGRSPKPYPDEGDSQGEPSPGDGYGQGDGQGYGQGYGQGELPYPIPSPIPNPNSSARTNGKKRRKHYGERFEAWYAIYPRKVAKGAAEKAYAAAVKRLGGESDNPEDYLFARVEAYAAAVKDWPETEQQYIPYPATWLNKERYSDNPKEWTRKTGRADGPKPGSVTRPIPPVRR
jgi:hypothetical protein